MWLQVTELTFAQRVTLRERGNHVAWLAGHWHSHRKLGEGDAGLELKHNSLEDVAGDGDQSSRHRAYGVALCKRENWRARDGREGSWWGSPKAVQACPAVGLHG